MEEVQKKRYRPEEKRGSRSRSRKRRKRVVGEKVGVGVGSFIDSSIGIDSFLYLALYNILVLTLLTKTNNKIFKRYLRK